MNVKHIRLQYIDKETRDKHIDEVFQRICRKLAVERSKDGR